MRPSILLLKGVVLHVTGILALSPLFLAGCPALDWLFPAVDPFTDVPPLALDGAEHELTSDIVPLGEFNEGQVVRLTVRGPAVAAVLILAADEEYESAGVLAGGGPANAAFDYRVQIPGRYFAYVQFDPRSAARGGTIQAEPGAPDYQPPAKQVVRVVFAEDYLTDPGLYDPVDGTEADRQLLAELSDLVAEEIIARLREIFADTPIEIAGPADPPPDAPFSTLTFDPRRVLAEEQDLVDTALPPADPSRPQCRERVIFGEVLPRGTMQDAGNRVRDDQAVVYVGSFQGRGAPCRTAATDSVNSMVLLLAQSGAHEIGHLLGLYHTEQVSLMHRTATVAFHDRQLDFVRGQMQVEKLRNGQVVSEVLTNVIQDADFYFRSAFAPR